MYRLTCHFGVLKNVFPASEVLPLGLKEFSELDDPLTNTVVSIVEAARLQSNTLASNKGCNCRGDCLIARYFCKKANVLCRSGYHPKNSKCKHKA
ncbi:hypothetical protein C2G38_2123792 [Gigaspora rosea]|uniref:Uncharacterized protein n=1 Tax=Gigaspora rosea TaxID=44941 RepID=A0A397U1S6_9GLOM|nr:hypothetical protein C2G38_2123792 [Gigaspora rosea]